MTEKAVKDLLMKIAFDEKELKKFLMDRKKYLSNPKLNLEENEIEALFKLKEVAFYKPVPEKGKLDGIWENFRIVGINRETIKDLK
jgi:hypothetical protein